MPDTPDRRHLISGVHSRGVLPHLKREHGTYFVTFRQAGTLPSEVVVRLKRERELILSKAVVGNRPLTWHERESLFQWYSRRVDRILDAGRGPCHLREEQCAKIVADAMKFFDGQRYELRAWVIMPNHVHVVIKPDDSQTLSGILHSWKSFTAHEMKRVLRMDTRSFWQRESYDHLVRNDADLKRCCSYTVMNPVTARLCTEPQRWPWSSAYAEPFGDARAS